MVRNKTYDKGGREKPETQQEMKPAISGKKETYDKAG